MDAEIIGMLEEKVEELLSTHAQLKRDYDKLSEENRKLIEDRDSIRKRIDTILVKLEGIV